MRNLLLILAMAIVFHSCTWLLLHPEVLTEAEDITSEVFEDIENLENPKQNKEIKNATHEGKKQ